MIREWFMFRGEKFTVTYVYPDIATAGHIEVEPCPHKYMSQVIKKAWKTIKDLNWWNAHQTAILNKEFDRKEDERKRGEAMMTSWRDEYTGEIFGNPNQTGVW